MLYFRGGQTFLIEGQIKILIFIEGRTIWVYWFYKYYFCEAEIFLAFFSLICHL